MLLNLQQNYSCYVTLSPCHCSAVILRHPSRDCSVSQTFTHASIRGRLQNTSLKIILIIPFNHLICLDKLYIMLVSGLYWTLNQSERLDYRPIFFCFVFTTFAMVHYFKKFEKIRDVKKDIIKQQIMLLQHEEGWQAFLQLLCYDWTIAAQGKRLWIAQQQH